MHNGSPSEPCAAAPALSEALGVDAHLWSIRSRSELEDLVEDLKKDSASAARVVTLKDVEDGAFLLRQVGEAVASLKGELPSWREKSEECFPQLVKKLSNGEGFIHSSIYSCMQVFIKQLHGSGTALDTGSTTEQNRQMSPSS